MASKIKLYETNWELIVGSTLLFFALFGCVPPAPTQPINPPGGSTRELQQRLIQLETIIRNSENECNKSKYSSDPQNASRAGAEMFWCMNAIDANHERDLIILELHRRGAQIP